jgi:hypothetical protein
MKFGFVSWDWKSHIDAREVSKIQKAINAPSLIIELDTGCDSYLIVVVGCPTEDPRCTLIKEDWCYIHTCTNYVDFNAKFKITDKGEYPAIYEASEDELRDYFLWGLLKAGRKR